MNDMHDNQTFSTSSQASPGEILHREREAMGLSLEEAATGLNLRPAVVRGLENDDYAEVPVAAYRRGYLRAYARLLGIDDTPVIQAYNARFGETETVKRVEPARVSRPPPRLVRWLFPLASLLVILGLVVLAVLWWQGREPATVEAIDADEPIAVDSLDGTTIISGESTLENQTPENDSASTSAPSGLESPTDTVASAPASESIVTTNGDSSAAEDNAGDGTAESPGVAPSSEATQDASSSAATSNDRILTFTFNKESWTEVVDANGQRIFVGLQSPDTQAKVEGEPPYRLTVGNANGVELRFRGETVDLTRIAGAGNVARFTLGE